MIVAGLFSAKVKNYDGVIDALSVAIRGQGAHVVAVFVQRRGVSDGGVALMDTPYSRRTLMTPGKIREITTACASLHASAVVFVNDLTAHQRQILSQEFDCPVLTGADLTPHAPPRSSATGPDEPAD